LPGSQHTLSVNGVQKLLSRSHGDELGENQ